MWAGACEKHDLVVHASEVDLAFSMLAIHRQGCEKKSWVETFRQYLDRKRRDVFMAELVERQKEVFKSGKGEA